MDKAKRICILTGMHLCHNPRVIKEAASLASAGFEVMVLGGFLDAALKRRDQKLLQNANFQFIPVIDLTQAPRRVFSPSRMAKLLFWLTGIETPWQLGEAYGHLAKAARSTDADLYICHMEQALAVGPLLLGDGRRVAVDMEDWYSEDLLPDARRLRPMRLLRRLERKMLQDGAFAICPSHAMAKAIALAYHCAIPTVIYNVFPWAERTSLAEERIDRRDAAKPSIYWFSQTLGRERGLEDLISSLPLINRPVEIHLRGKPATGFKEWLEEQIPREWKNRIFFHGPVDNSELLPRIAEHDIGFAGERPDPPNKDLTVSNKIFHYLLGGLAVVASNTAGQREIAVKAGEAIKLYEARNPQSLAAQLNLLLDSPGKLAAAKAAALDIARRDFCWEIQESRLVDLVAETIDPAGVVSLATAVAEALASAD